MRKDELERFVGENREEFDQIESFDSDKLWYELDSTGVETGLSRKKIAAWVTVVTICLVLATYLNSVYNQNQSFETIAGLSEEQEMQRDEMIQFVNFKQQKLEEKNIDVSKLGDFAKELQGLDEIEQLILGDFPESVNKEKLVKSMLQYYESKGVLELILLEFEKKEKNEIYESEIY